MTNQQNGGMIWEPAMSAVNVTKPAGRRKVIAADEKRRLFGCLNAALDKKAEEVVVLDLRGISAVADFFVICTGTSNRQVQAIADGVENALRDMGAKYYNIEGRGAGSWVLLDFHSIVVHVFHSASRAFYALDNLWSDARRLDAGEIMAWG
jgi:ribosome-associated protein